MSIWPFNSIKQQNHEQNQSAFFTKWKTAQHKTEQLVRPPTKLSKITYRLKANSEGHFLTAINPNFRKKYRITSKHKSELQKCLAVSLLFHGSLRDFFVFWLASARRRMLEMQPAAASCMIESPLPTNGSSFWNRKTHLYLAVWLKLIISYIPLLIR